MYLSVVLGNTPKEWHNATQSLNKQKKEFISSCNDIAERLRVELAIDWIQGLRL